MSAPGRLRPVAPGVLVATSRRDATNSLVVTGRSSGVLLIDPAWTPDELAGLARELRGRGLRPSAGFATHAHFDHLLWHPAFGDVPRWATGETARRARTERAALLAELGPGHETRVLERLGGVAPLPGDRLPWDGPEVQVIRHDAHVPGHAALWLPAQRVLIAGDMLSDVEVPLLDAVDSGDAYAAGLDALAPFADRALVVVPGHGRPCRDGRERLTADRRYLAALAAGVRPDDRRLRNPAMQAAWEDASQAPR